MSSLAAITPPGVGEWIAILLVLVLLFGAKKLPELGSSVGKSIKNFKKGIGEAGDDDDGDDPSDVVGQDEVTETSGRERNP